MSEPRDFPNSEFFQKLSDDQIGFQRLADWLKAHVGIHMPASPKNYTLMASRLSKVLSRLHLRSYADLHKLLQKGDAKVQKIFIEALTTNKTEFFREAHHFEVLPQALHEIQERRGPGFELRVWCAAASRGHEPYSILFTLLEAGFKPQSQRLKFLASDIDQTVLEAASKGVYRADELQDVRSDYRSKYMIRLKDASNGMGRWKVRDELRELVTFARVNLIDFPYPFQHRFDIIFCRNVLIYFEREMVQKVKEHLAGALAPAGYLFVGHSETGSARLPDLQSIDAAIFKKREEAS